VRRSVGGRNQIKCPETNLVSNFCGLERSTGSLSLFHRSIPPRRTDTCSKPAFENISAALDERSSVRQMVVIGFRLISVSSRIVADSSAIGMLHAPAM
jgi:hypothetical protein